MCANITSRLCECCAVSCAPAPAGVRITSGTPTLPPNIWRTLAAWFTTMSMATRMKLIVMISTTGPQAEHRGADAGADEALLGDRRLAHAARAVLRIEAGGDLVGALEAPDLLAHEEHALVARELLVERAPQRLAVGHARHERVPSRSPNGPPRAIGANCSRQSGSP